jgi:hypothetical protein
MGVCVCPEGVMQRPFFDLPSVQVPGAQEAHAGVCMDQRGLFISLLDDRRTCLTFTGRNTNPCANPACAAQYNTATPMNRQTLPAHPLHKHVHTNILQA